MAGSGRVPAITSATARSRSRSGSASNHVRVVRDPHFHDAQSVRLDAVEYIPSPDLNTGLQMFRAGVLDTMVNFPPQKLDFLRTEMPGALHLSPSLGATLYLFNFRKPLFRDVRIRKALALALDRDILTTRVVRTGDVPAYGLVPSSVPGYLPALGPAIRTQAQRLAEARRLLAEAGYSPRKPLQFELLYHTSEEHRSVAVAAVAMWNAVGVKATLRNAERRVVEAATRSGDFDMVRSALFAPYPDPNGLLVFFRSGNSANGSAYANRGIRCRRRGRGAGSGARSATRRRPAPRRAAAGRRPGVPAAVLHDQQATGGETRVGMVRPQPHGAASGEISRRHTLSGALHCRGVAPRRATPARRIAGAGVAAHDRCCRVRARA